MAVDSHEIEIRVRYAECDAMGVAHHGVYPAWLEMGRTELLRQTGVSYRELEERGVFIVVVALEIRYRRPARYDDLLRLVTTLANSGRAKLEHAYEILRGDELLATAKTTLACVDRDGAVQALPEFLAARV